jgi:hypothetical protein
MTWALVVVGGTAVLGAGASYLGSKKQSDASKAAAGINMEQYARTRGDLMPFTQAGYGATSKLSTLLGINPNPNAARMALPPPNPGYAPDPNGGVRPIMQMPTAQQPMPHQWNVPEANLGNLPLNRILMVRAQNGDRQAQAMLQRMQP